MNTDKQMIRKTLTLSVFVRGESVLQYPGGVSGYGRVCRDAPGDYASGSNHIGNTMNPKAWPVVFEFCYCERHEVSGRFNWTLMTFIEKKQLSKPMADGFGNPLTRTNTGLPGIELRTGKVCLGYEGINKKYGPPERGPIVQGAMVVDSTRRSRIGSSGSSSHTTGPHDPRCRS